MCSITSVAQIDFSYSSIPIFRLRCRPCSMLWGWQYQTMSNTGFPCIFVLRVNASQATITDTSLHIFRPWVHRPSLFSIRNRRHVLVMATLCQPVLSTGPKTAMYRAPGSWKRELLNYHYQGTQYHARLTHFHWAHKSVQKKPHGSNHAEKLVATGAF